MITQQAEGRTRPGRGRFHGASGPIFLSPLLSRGMTNLPPGPRSSEFSDARLVVETLRAPLSRPSGGILHLMRVRPWTGPIRWDFHRRKGKMGGQSRWLTKEGTRPAGSTSRSWLSFWGSKSTISKKSSHSHSELQRFSVSRALCMVV